MPLHIHLRHRPPRPQRRSRIIDSKDSVASTEQPARKRRRADEQEKGDRKNTSVVVYPTPA
jgi:hypothetical protein